MGSATSRSNTYAANATGSPIRVYYSVDMVELTDMVVEFEAEAGSEKQSGSAKTELTFKKDTRIRYVRIPVNDFVKFSGEGALKVSVFVEGQCSHKCEVTICHNYPIPIDRSFIVTENHNIKLQKYGEDIWMEEDGTMHR